MTVTLKELDIETWRRYWPEVRHAHLLQSWEYGQAKCRAERWRSHRFLVENEGRQPQGLIQALEFSVPVLGGIAGVNRGPVFFSNHREQVLTPEAISGLLSALAREARRRRWWYLRVVPNLCEGSATDAIILAQGFRKRRSGPRSAWLAINRAPGDIRAGFHDNWRRQLKKAEKSGVTVEVVPFNEGLSWLTPRYQQMQREKDFHGIPGRLLRSIVDERGPRWRPHIAFAVHGGERVGGIFFQGHGDTVTYLVGWLPDKGRELRANHLLFWNALLTFIDEGYRYFDVGGLSASASDGISQFKRGMGGEEYVLAGEYSYWTVGGTKRSRPPAA